MTTLSVIIPANNEAGYIGPCLAALRAQTLDPGQTAEIIVAANACTDPTVAQAESARADLHAAGWQMTVLDLAAPGKLNALNQADAIARGDILVYLDADVICSPDIMRQLIAALDTDVPRYASGQLRVAQAQSFVTRHFARVWAELPFMKTNVQGAGLFAVNRTGRARWGAFPDVIADDGFVRLQFAPDERIRVDAVYHWPMVEGFANLVRVRRRQDAGVRELTARFPQIMHNESKPPMTLRDHLALCARMPISYATYVTVMLAVKATGRSSTNWERGR